MKRVILSFLFIYILSCNNKQDIPPDINGMQLLSVVEHGSLKEFKVLIAKAKFSIVDSSSGTIDGKEFVGYSAEDTLKPKNTLDAHFTEDLHVSFITFTTYSKKSFDQLKKSFEDLDFKVWKRSYETVGYRKENSSIEIIMMSVKGEREHYNVLFERIPDHS